MLFSDRVIAWHKRCGRHDLPWQRPRNLYRVWVSEIMLQQTQVTTVLPYFCRFLRTFPNVKQLAEAPLDSVLAHWSGLGYYARARNLHRAARMVRAEGGRLPRTVENWMRLPGVGRSTAGAIVSLALEQPAAMLDGNARRVLARHQGLPARANAALWQQAEALLPEIHAAAYTQGLMDLGAMVCTSRLPACDHCPVQVDCHYRQHPDSQEETLAATRVHDRTLWMAVLHASDGQILLRQREQEGLWGGLWGFPEFTSRTQVRHWSKKYGRARQWHEKPSLTHRLSHLKLILHPLHTKIPETEKSLFERDGRWFDPKHLDVGVAAIVPKLLQQP